jgi:hypothetical protein
LYLQATRTQAMDAESATGQALPGELERLHAVGDDGGKGLAELDTKA